MREIIIALIAVFAVITADLTVTAREAAIKQQVDVLQREKAALSRQLIEFEAQLRALQNSHELYIFVTEDIDRRLVRVEAGKGPVWREE